MKRRLLTTIVAVAITTIMWGNAVLATPQTMSDGQLFDPEFYAQTYPDVAAAFGTDAAALYQHYVACGKTEGRLPYADSSAGASTSIGPTIQTMPDGGRFDPTYYASQNPDVVAAVGTDAAALYQHYLNSGKSEGRLPYANADTNTTRWKATVGAGTADASALALSDGLAAFNSLGTVVDQQNLAAIYNLAPNLDKVNSMAKLIVMAPIKQAFKQWARKSLAYPSSAQIISTKQSTLATSLAYDVLNPYYSVMLNQFMTDTGIDPTYITDGKCMAFEVEYMARNSIGGYVTGTMLGIYETKNLNSWCGGTDPNSSSYVALTSLAYSGNNVIALP